MRTPALVGWAIIGIAGAARISAAELTVTYQSDPPGAALYFGEKFYGYTPVSLKYEITRSQKEQGSMSLAGMSVKWASGAEASLPYLTADLKNGKRQQFTFRRPNVQGRETDMQIALQMQQLSLMKQQANAAQAAAYAQRQQQFWNQLAQLFNRPRPRADELHFLSVGQHHPDYLQLVDRARSDLVEGQQSRSPRCPRGRRYGLARRADPRRFASGRICCRQSPARLRP